MIGTKLADRYEIVGELGRGGMGVVYRARDPLLDRDVAIKVVPPAMLTPDAELRFQREAQVVARMDHPAIVTVYDIGRHEGSLFFVMPVISGTNLRVLLRERSLRLGDVVDLAVQVADALDYSHNQGVVHRDIKPENVMVWRTENDSLRVRIMDFGLARASLESQLTRITHSGTIIGTVSYFSPEQVSATHEVDARSDIYSFGTVLYECLLGEPPFAGEVQSILYRIVHENPQPPNQRGADVDFELEQIAMRCLAREPTARPQT
ncbi:MAG: serine/threonine-protein kinase, partial [Blastocatellia bacterium]